MAKLQDFSFFLRDREYLPLMIGGMGVDISTAGLALEAARLGGIGHISDAMSPYLSDRSFGTRFQKEKFARFRDFRETDEKEPVKWDPADVYKAQLNHVGDAMNRKRGTGAIFANIMEKLQMGAPKETLRARLHSAMEAGIDGITLSAGLHLHSLDLMADHPRFREVSIGIIVSSARALKLFLKSGMSVNRLPDYVVVEGPLAGGHLGFGLDWQKYRLEDIVQDVLDLLRDRKLNIPVIPAGGIFTSTDAYRYILMGASALQVATRFTITKECGLPEHVKHIYLQSSEDDVMVNMTSPAGYPMRMLKSSPSLRSNVRPNCEALGYMLDRHGNCAYRDAYNATPTDENGEKLPVTEKMCICYHFMKHQCYTCGHNVFRLKDTCEMADGRFILPPAEAVFLDYVASEAEDDILEEQPLLRAVAGMP